MSIARSSREVVTVKMTGVDPKHLIIDSGRIDEMPNSAQITIRIAGEDVPINYDADVTLTWEKPI